MAKAEISTQKPVPVPAAPPPAKKRPPARAIKRETGLRRIQGYPLLKRAIVMNEILGPPGGLGGRS